MMKRMLLIASVIISLLAAGCTGIILPKGTATIQGKVTLYGEEPGDVEVFVGAAGTRFVTRVKPDGSFSLELPAPGHFTIETSGPGVAASSTPVQLKKGDKLGGILFDTIFLPLTPYTFTFNNATDAHLIDVPWGEYSITDDPLGNRSFFFHQGNNERPPFSFNTVRFALLKYTNVDNFEISWKSIGGDIGGDASWGNRSQAIIFGYQNPDNYYMVYLQYDTSARVTRILSGKESDIGCKPNVVGLWERDNHQYQEVKARVTTEGNQKIVRTFVDGVEVASLYCEIPVSEYEPGRVGFGAISFSRGDWAHYTDVTFTNLDEI